MPSYSQTSFQKYSDSAAVPILALKNALIVLEQRDFCYNNLKITRDSIYSLNQIISNKDTLISGVESTVSLKDSTIKKYEDIIVNKDREIEIYRSLYNKERYEKWGGIIGIIVLIGVLYF